MLLHGDCGWSVLTREEGYTLDLYVRLDGAGCVFVGREKRREGQTNMFRALEPMMKAEASKRRALENCMFDRGVCLKEGDIDFLDDLEC